jgi:hypothetical protein
MAAACRGGLISYLPLCRVIPSVGAASGWETKLLTRPMHHKAARTPQPGRARPGPTTASAVPKQPRRVPHSSAKRTSGKQTLGSAHPQPTSRFMGDHNPEGHGPGAATASAVPIPPRRRRIPLCRRQASRPHFATTLAAQNLSRSSHMAIPSAAFWYPSPRSSTVEY